MKQYTFARADKVTLEQAKAYVEAVRGQDCRVETRFELTLGAMVDHYLDEYVRTTRTAQSLYNARSALTRNLAPLRTRKVHDITAADLHEIILTVKRRAPTMAQALRSELRQAWSYALAIGMTDAPCPITSMTGGKFTRHKRDRILNDGELAQLMTTLQAFSPTLQHVITISLHTGMRSGEIIQLRNEDIETIDGVLWIEVPREFMKNDQAHRVPMFGPAREAIEIRNKAYYGRLFPAKRGGQVRQADLAREVYNKTGGLWRLHDLRRTARTNLQRIGCPFESSEAILAHKLPGVAGVYARYWYHDEKIEWLRRLADHYKEIIYV